MTERELKNYFIDRYEVSDHIARRMILDKTSQDNELKNHVKHQITVEYEKEIKRLKSDHTKWTNELRTKIEKLSQDDTRLKELLSQYIEGTEALQHKVALTDANTTNREFSAGYCKALQDLMRHFEGIDYEIID